MAKEKFPMTPAIRALKKSGIDFSLCPYKYEEKGGTAVAAKELNVDEHLVIKTLVMERENGDAFLILMHGDREVSTKSLARALGTKTVRSCDPQKAGRHTGYVVGGISPFGIRTPLNVCVEESIMSLPKIYINAGKRGLLVRIRPQELDGMLTPTRVNVAR